MRGALAQAWPPFVLVAGLILVGAVAARDGVFDRLGRTLAQAPGGDAGLLSAALAATAVVSAVLNLDTAAVFATPVLVLAARERGLDERPFLLGALFMANAGSLFLPGSNLTNLLVLGHGHLGGLAFARRLLPEALAASVVTALGVLAWQRRLRSAAAPAARSPAPARLRALGPVGVVAAGACVLVLRHPALPVLGVGVAVAFALLARGRLSPRETLDALGLPVLLGLFAAAVGLGALARAWTVPADLVRDAAAVPTAAVGALAAVLVNNLPAAALLSAGPVRHPGALLLGLNVGPNLAVTGSLSSYLCWTSARRVDARPSAALVSRVGVLVAPAAIAAALLARWAAGS